MDIAMGENVVWYVSTTSVWRWQLGMLYSHIVTDCGSISIAILELL